MPSQLILWMGPKHSGKTTQAATVAQVAADDGFAVAGVLAPSIYQGGKLVGYDVLDLQQGTRSPLARHKTDADVVGRFTFLAEGLELGGAALRRQSTRLADIVIIDEFGPLELGGGWRRNVDELLTLDNTVVLLVIREQIDGLVQKLCSDVPVIRLPASNVGKTKLACAVIRRCAKSSDIVGIKGTTIKARDGRCPRGGEGCGVCSSLEGEFCITEETGREPYKDTARLRSAGAKRVFWLRVMQSRLEQAIDSALEVIGPDAVTVRESNSLRQVVEPGLFLIVTDRSSRAWKNSARRVRDYADKIVVRNGTGFDLDVERISLADGRWLLREQATAIIMAGGNSSRMGCDRRMPPIGGRTMIQVIYEQLRGTFDQILVSANQAQGLAFLGAQIVPDRITGQGPLMGIASTHEVSANEFNFVVACDIPTIEVRYVRRMLAAAENVDLVIPTTGQGQYEPLFAVYRKSALPAINKTLSSDKRKVTDILPRCKVKFIDLPDNLVNLNTMAEYEEFRKKSDA